MFTGLMIIFFVVSLAAATVSQPWLLLPIGFCALLMWGGCRRNHA